MEWSLDSAQPIVPGKTGWPPGRTAWGEVNGWHLQFRRYPSLIRIFARSDPEGFPVMSEQDMIIALEDLWRDETARRSVRVLEPEDFTRPGTQKLLTYIKQTPLLLSRWHRSNGRAKSVFMGALELQEQLLDGGRLYPWEIAHMRIPWNLLCDDHVVMMQASCQGMHLNDTHAFLGAEKDYPDVMRSEYQMVGLEKLLTNRWFRFALAAPYMSQFGIEIGRGTGFTRNVSRAEYLLEHPYHATDGELTYIENSAQYQVGFASAAKAMSLTNGCRKHPPPSPIYYPNRFNVPRRNTLEEWCIWSKGRQRHGG